ncbi:MULTISPECIES: TolC family protein [unclassified Duganella]|uniref:TolC family protein n=1 Tax=unclassified Duganella TaxID=2636909 RepID=UPI000E34562C|nr:MULTISPECIES: TolC family protein [unclassified Duganella]RFP08193.1 TolC family protein [Duganella sp. BJB475]RFP22485.1 TolC family protein [Duganella sp. BJB476]
MYKYLLPLVVAAWPAYAQAEIEPSAPLTLKAALALAGGANAELAAARHELGALDGAVRQAGLSPNPTLSVERLDTRRDTRETTVQLSQPLELGGKRAARVQAAERGRDGAAAELALRQAGIRAAVIDGWFAVLAAQEHVRLAQQAAELAQRAAGATARRVVAGKVSPVEETRARVAASSAQLDLIRARSLLAGARQRLATLWGNPAPRFERVDGASEALSQLPELAPAEAMRHRLQGAPALALARAELARRQALAQVELSKRTPDLTFNVGGKRSEELGRTQALFGISLPLPLFDRNQGSVLESARRVDKARDELAATALRLEAELAQARAEFDLARQQAQALRADILPGAQSAYDAASTGFEYGKFGFLDVLDAQRTLLQAQTLYLNALADAHRALAVIGRILGEEHE